MIGWMNEQINLLNESLKTFFTARAGRNRYGLKITRDYKITMKENELEFK